MYGNQVYVPMLGRHFFPFLFIKKYFNDFFLFFSFQAKGIQRPSTCAVLGMMTLGTQSQECLSLRDVLHLSLNSNVS